MKKCQEEKRNVFLRSRRINTTLNSDKIIAKQNYDIQAFEGRKMEKYNADNLFKKTQTFKEINIDEKNNNLPIEHKEKFFTKFVNFIKKLLSFHESGMLD
jgi:hypothetical protein